jgi:histidinol-phosphate aminotransferase
MAPSFVRPTVRQSHGYTPGEQPGAGERVIKLNTNENPFAPSPKVIQALQQVESEMLRRYPNPTADLFRAAAAKVHDVTPDQIIAGNGSDDILDIAMRTFLAPDDLLAFPDPTYSLYPVLAELNESRSVGVPWDKDWALPVETLLATKAKAIFLANPNAPTGTYISATKMKELAKKFPGLLLIDEAYADFAGENCIELVKDHENVVISRTLSKSHSLAGLRFGYGIAQESVIREMMKVKDSYNTDAISVCLATAAIEDVDYARQTWENVRAERERLTDELTTLGWTVLPSRANFILCTVPDANGKAAYLGLKQQGILVRYFDKPGLQDKVRITVGQSQENNALLAGIKALTSKEKAA